MAGSRMRITGSARRHALSYLAVLRGTSSYYRQARQLHTVLALIALVLVLPSEHAAAAVPLVLVGLSGPGLNYLLAHYDRGRLRSVSGLRWLASSTERKEGRHQLNLPALLEIIGVLTLTAAFSWVVDDLSAGIRLTGLLATAALGVSVAHAIFSDHTWYNPAETSPPWWHEALRRVAGLSTTALVGVVALPGHWTPAERSAVAVVSAFPLVVGVRIRNLDRVIVDLPAVAAEEHQRGRDLVITETERALGRPLAELERLAAEQAADARVLLALATHARSRLRETLAAVEQPGLPRRSVDELLGPVLTLARAIGVAVEVEVSPGALTDSALPTAVWVLRDLVGNAINADATHVWVDVCGEGAEVRLAVSDDGRPMPAGVWKSAGTSSARLERHLILLGGSLAVREKPGGKVVTAAFVAGERRQGHEGAEQTPGPIRHDRR